jgi:hypothetical protein
MTMPVEMTKSGGVDMREMGWAPGSESGHEAVRVVVGIALLMLVSGIWVCLWVPPF